MKRFILITMMSFIVLIQAVKAESNWNIRTAPISDALGIYNVEVDYTLNEKFTIGPMYYHFDYELSDTTYQSDAVGLRLNYFFNGVKNGGWLLGLSGLYGTFDISEVRASDGLNYSASLSTRIFTGMLSYQAVWDSFNITSGIGMSYFSLPETVVAANNTLIYTVDTSLLSGATPNLEFTLGWRF